ncbi:MAG: hypothetical protein EBS32_08825 [Actinobacteria bacterium]|nr:hypothetical protein [Actinomycetota bacterium]
MELRCIGIRSISSPRRSPCSRRRRPSRRRPMPSRPPHRLPHRRTASPSPTTSTGKTSRVRRCHPTAGRFSTRVRGPIS